MPTVLDLYTLQVDTSAYGRISLALWDTARLPDYSHLRPLSYAKTNVFLVCYSVVDPESFYDIETYWLPELQRYEPQVPFAIIACKTDAREGVEQRGGVEYISTAQGKELAKRIGARTFLECSAMTGEGVLDVIEAIAEIGMTHTLGRAKGSSGCILC